MSRLVLRVEDCEGSDRPAAVRSMVQHLSVSNLNRPRDSRSRVSLVKPVASQLSGCIRARSRQGAPDVLGAHLPRTTSQLRPARREQEPRPTSRLCLENRPRQGRPRCVGSVSRGLSLRRHQAYRRRSTGFSRDQSQLKTPKRTARCAPPARRSHPRNPRRNTRRTAVRRWPALGIGLSCLRLILWPTSRRGTRPRSCWGPRSLPLLSSLGNEANLEPEHSDDAVQGFDRGVPVA